MGRLIDADAFLQNLINYDIGRKSLEEVIKAIREQPTAYDPDEVVKELEEETEWAFNRYIDCPHDNPRYEICREQYYERKRCLEIVKGGVVGG